MSKNHVEGYKEFRGDIYPAKKDLFEELASGQHPHTLFVTCSDSRVVPDLILQTNPGELFIVRNAGNMVPAYGGMIGGIAATIEYGLMALGIRQIIICGHSDCGAMKGVLYPEKVKELPTVSAWLRNGSAARMVTLECYPELGEAEQLEVLTRENILAQVDNLRTHPSVAALMAKGELAVHAWHFTIATGEVTAFDCEQGDFLPLDGPKAPVALPPSRLCACRRKFGVAHVQV